MSVKLGTLKVRIFRNHIQGISIKQVPYSKNNSFNMEPLDRILRHPAYPHCTDPRVAQIISEIKRTIQKYHLTERVRCKTGFKHYKECPYTIATPYTDLPGTCLCCHINMDVAEALRILENIRPSSTLKRVARWIFGSHGCDR